MRTANSFVFFVASISIVASGCSSAVESHQDASTVKDLEDFDPATFNGGDSFEYLVNPTYTRNGEHAAEMLAEADRPWLAAIDAFAEEREYRNFVVYQQETDADAIAEHNAALASLLTRESETTEGFSLAQARGLYRLLVTQPQVTDHGHYDPQYSIGFCFGRAMMVHGFAKNAFVRGPDAEIVSKKTVPARKIWVTGPMGQWKHHVATMVAAQEAGVGFWVIDNYVGTVKSAADWMTHLRTSFSTANVMFNVSRANRFSEANDLRYYQVLLDDPFFNDFFRDFLVATVPPLLANGGVELTP